MLGLLCGFSGHCLYWLADFGDNEFDVRLAGSNHKWSGRLEIFRFGKWGTVCQRGFTAEAAQVVCRQLGVANAASARLLSTYARYYGSGSGQIWLDVVSCKGNETSLNHCTHSQWGEHSCAHDADMFLTCFGQLYKCHACSHCLTGMGGVDVHCMCWDVHFWELALHTWIVI